MTPGAAIASDWHPGAIPQNVALDPTAHVATSYSFSRYRSALPVGLRLGPGASLYDGTVLDVGPCGCVVVGQYALVQAARIICDGEVRIGDYALVSWNVLLMDTYRLPCDAVERRRAVEHIASGTPADLGVAARPIQVGRGAWIGFEACILPGVSVGDGAIVGARSVVVEDVPAGMLVAGNPARIVRRVSG